MSRHYLVISTEMNSLGVSEIMEPGWLSPMFRRTLLVLICCFCHLEIFNFIIKLLFCMWRVMKECSKIMVRRGAYSIHVSFPHNLHRAFIKPHDHRILVDHWCMRIQWDTRQVARQVTFRGHQPLMQKMKTEKEGGRNCYP